ncbi:unnamed protein product, partial [Pleuronectes platessa]
MAARYTAEMVRQMLYDGEAVMGLDSESDISDDEDQDYCPGGSGSRPPGNPTEQDKSDSEESSSVSSEEESVQIMSNRMSWKGSYWSELPPTQGRTQSHNILRSRGRCKFLQCMLFLKELSKELVTPHMMSGLEGCPQLQTTIIEAMERCHNPATGKKQTGQTKEKEVSDLP